MELELRVASLALFDDASDEADDKSEVADAVLDSVDETLPDTVGPMMELDPILVDDVFVVELDTFPDARLALESNVEELLLTTLAEEDPRLKATLEARLAPVVALDDVLETEVVETDDELLKVGALSKAAVEPRLVNEEFAVAAAAAVDFEPCELDDNEPVVDTTSTVEIDVPRATVEFEVDDNDATREVAPLEAGSITLVRKVELVNGVDDVEAEDKVNNVDVKNDA
ncbi:hypothetical protein TruAng_007030 [Truncatella angustata]|nr:hypothetical protein TruAng_007030 [Truncatella angustata]